MIIDEARLVESLQRRSIVRSGQSAPTTLTELGVVQMERISSHFFFNFNYNLLARLFIALC